MVRAIGVLMLGLISVGASAQRILGYFPDYRATNTIQYDKITDIAFSFINPQTNGSLQTWVTPGDNLYSFDENKFLTVKAGCQTNGVNLWLAVGGADDNELRSARLNSVTGNATYRATLISDLVAYGVTHSLYGISIDWEFPKNTAAKNNHETFLRELRAAIDASSRPQMQLSIAVGGETVGNFTHTNYINTAVLTDPDLLYEVHIMAYDFPSNNYDANNHSTYTDAATAINGWAAKGLPKSKMLVCVPFYGRSSNRATELGYNELGGSAATNYDADYASGVYYNGKSTLEDKCDLIISQGGLGVCIWDLGQDRTDQYSLLGAIYDKMNSLCPAPQPNLGADQGVCGDVNILLDGGVASSSGRTFEWFNGTTSVGSNPTYTATDNGVYTLEVSQGGCMRSDVVEIVAGSPLTASGEEGCEGDNLNVSVNNPDGGITYEWFDAEIGGANLGTGSSIEISNASATATYYVQEQTSNTTYNPGLAGPAPGLTAEPWVWANVAGSTGQWIRVETDITIKSVMIHTYGGATGVKLVAVDEFGNIAAGETDAGVTIENHPNNPAPNWDASKTCHINAVTTTLTPNMSLPPGDYMLTIVGTATSAMDECDVDFGTAMQSEMEITDVTIDIDGDMVDGEEETGVYFLEGACHIAWGHTEADGTYGNWAIADARADGAHIHYGILFSMEIETGASSSCPRAEATVIVNDCTPLSINIDSPTDGSTHDLADMPLTFDVTTAGTVESVVYTISGPDGFSAIVQGSALNGYDLEYDIEANGGGAGVYTISVAASNSVPENASDDISIQITAIGFAELFENAGIELFPNPSTESFNIKADELAGYTINVFTSNGTIVETTSTTGSDLSFGSELDAGVYTVELITEEHVYSTKIVKN